MSNSKSGDFVTGLQDAIRQNPVSAALVGMGILWMFTGGNRMTASAALLPSAARAAATGVGSALQNSADAVGAVTEGMRSAGSRVVDGVRDTISGASVSVRETASQAYDAVKGAVSDSTSKTTQSTTVQAGTAQGMAGVLQSNLKDTFERQPLLLGAIGLAVGAGMAAGLPSTQIEAEFAGDTADRVTAQVKEFASEQIDRVTETAKRTLDAVKEEAAAQGLTPEAAKDGAVAIGEKVKTVANAARGRSA
jgi:hypothetical protein